MYKKCSKCKRELQEKIDDFENKFVNYGVVEKKAECKECDFVDASQLAYCVECGAEIREP